MSWIPSPHFWISGSALFTIGSFALFAILGFAGIASMTDNYRNLMIVGYTIAIILFFIGWWQTARQEEASAKRDADFTSIQSDLNKIANSANVSLNQSATEIAAAVIRKIEPLQRQVDKLSTRENDVLYQDGRAIARVAGISQDPAKTSVFFQAVTSEREIDFSKEIELQNARMMCRSLNGPSSIMSSGASQKITYYDVTCKINGPRQ